MPSAVIMTFPWFTGVKTFAPEPKSPYRGQLRRSGANSGASEASLAGVPFAPEPNS